jgi:hypothetical protein
MAGCRTNVVTCENRRLLQGGHYTALSEKPIARMIAERLRPPVIERFDLPMPRYVHDFEHVGAIFER